jgi:hypothetical protein
MTFVTDTYLMVLWTDAPKLFQIGLRAGYIAACQRYTIGGPVFSLAAFATHDFQLISIMGFARSDKITVVPISVSKKAEFTVTAFRPCPRVISLTYCPVNDLVFFSRQDSPFLMGRLNDLLSARRNLIEVGLPGVADIRFCSCFPNVDSLMLFESASTNVLYTLELTDSAIEVSKLPTAGEFELFDRRLE